ncbi:MAG: dihydrodipicolinate reductase [Pseudomonadota bacterium]
MSTVLGKELKRFGIVVRVTEDGQITGTGFGRPVRGAWNWQDGFFCRSLYWGQRDLGPNCQEVRVNGEMIRFTSDLGNGIYADLKME